MSDNIFAENNRNVLENRFVLNKIIKFGQYKQSGNDNDWKTEPIEWKVISKYENTVLLLSEIGLDCHEYGNDYDLQWSTSELRRWLNHDFILAAFSDTDRKALVKKYVDCSDDYAFILDDYEIERYLGSYPRKRKLIYSDYCKSKVNNKDNHSYWDNYCSWWSRTKCYSRGGLQGVVDYEGKFYKKISYNIASNKDIVVRPAIWVNIFSDVFLTNEEKEDTAQRLFDEKDYVNAEKCYQKLKDSEKVKLCKYYQAKKLLNEGSYVDAYNIFITISDYQDVAKILKLNENIMTLKNLIDKCYVGNTIKFGKYFKNNSNEKESIEWLVLKRDEDDTILVIAKNAIDCRIFDNKKEEVLWGNSEICNFLNSEFYEEAFSDQEKECIWSSIVKNNCCSRFNNKKNEIQNSTEEYNVFLLSIDEVNQYFPESDKRKCKATPYSKQNGAFVEFGNYCWWWLRNQGYESNKVSYVDNNGQIIENGANVSCNDICVSPAIKIGASFPSFQTRGGRLFRINGQNL